VAAELLQHTTEELLHADMPANRIIQLGGKPLTEPQKWYEWSGCGYEPPDERFL
jgi:bacterioferritin